MSLILTQNNVLSLWGYNFHWCKMNSTFAVISTLIKSNIKEKRLKNYLMNVSTKELKDYLECASIYKGTSPKKETGLTEMIVYGCMTGTLNKKDIEDITIKEVKQILNKNSITIDSLPGHGNMGLKKKEIKSCDKEKKLLILLNKK